MAWPLYPVDGGATPAEPGDGADRLPRAVAARDRAFALRYRLGAIETELTRAADAADAARERLTRAEREVARLESLSLTRLLSSLRDAREDDLQRERSERDAADAALHRVEATERSLQQHHEQVSAELAALGDTDAEYAAALAAQEQRLLADGAPGAARLAELARRRVELGFQRQALRDASAAGARARALLAEALEHLETAADRATTYGIARGAIGDGQLVNRLDEAIDLAREAQRAIGPVRQQLPDLDLGLRLDVWRGPGDRVAAVLLAELRFDRRVERHIGVTGTSVARALRRLAEALAELERRHSRLTTELAELTAERERLLAGD